MKRLKIDPDAPDPADVRYVAERDNLYEAMEGH